MWGEKLSTHRLGKCLVLLILVVDVVSNVVYNSGRLSTPPRPECIVFDYTGFASSIFNQSVATGNKYYLAGC